MLTPAACRAELPDARELQGSKLREGRELQGADVATEVLAYPEVVGRRRVFPLRDVQNQEDRRQVGREARGDAGAAVRHLQRQEARRKVFQLAGDGERQAWQRAEVLRLLVPEVHGAKLPDMQGVQESRLRARSELQGPHLAFVYDEVSADSSASPVLPERQVPDAAAFGLRGLENEGGLFTRAAQTQ